MLEIKFNLVKEERKALVAAIGEIMDVKPRYLGAPGFKFEVGACVVDKVGTVTFNHPWDADSMGNFLSQLEARGFVYEKEPDSEPAENMEHDGSESGADNVLNALPVDGVTVETAEREADSTEPVIAGDENISGDPANEPIGASQSVGGEFPAEVNGASDRSETSDSGGVPDGSEVSAGDTAARLSVDVPLSGFTSGAIINIEKLVAAKAWIFKKMAGTDELPIERTEDQLCFPWFKKDSSPQKIDAYSRLIARLCETAKAKQRVASNERPSKEGDNEKFKARCTLLMLGFIGDEYAQARKILLSPFSGNGSFLKGDGKKDAAISIDSLISAVTLSREVNGDTPGAPAAASASLRCGECGFHCYYTGGPLLTDAGDVVDTSKRTPDIYTYYCLNTPSGFRKIKHAAYWSGCEPAPKWCPRRASADVQNGGGDTNTAETGTALIVIA